MQEIVFYSMGICSAYIAARLAQDCKKPLCLWSDTGKEDADTYRFGREVAEYFNLEIVEASNGVDMWEKWRHDNIIPARTLAKCSREFKIEPSRDWLQDYDWDNRDESNDTRQIARVAYGYDVNEIKRADRSRARWDYKRIGLWFPLMEWNVTKAQCFGFFHEVGIAPPRMYQHFQHANCLPCKNFRKKDWVALQFHYPEHFARALVFENEMQESCGARWMQDGPLLRELPESVAAPSRKGRHKLAAIEPAFSFDMGCDSCATN